ncbi:MAG: hypothetical protein MIO93_04115 [ANME-2 cluster archaeon]|nr:hypothetical protein [ANME-2 cluster archaeon]
MSDKEHKGIIDHSASPQKNQTIKPGSIDLKEKTAKDLVVTIAMILASLTFIISFQIISYSFQMGMLIWGIIVVLILLIFMVLLLGTVILVLNFFSKGQFRSIVLNDLEFSNVEILGKKNTNTQNKIVIISKRDLVLAMIISIPIIIYSFYTSTLLWGIIAAVMIMILTPILSGFILLIKNLLVR